MKNPKKPPFSLLERTAYTAILLVLSPILIPIMMVMFLWQLSYHLPIIFQMRTQPLYWLTWHEVKRMSGRSTYEALDCLTSGTQGRFFECRYRDREIVEKLLRRVKTTLLPPATGPRLFPDAIFFEFRIKDRVGRPRPKFFNPLSLLVPSLQPAYVR